MKLKKLSVGIFSLLLLVSCGQNQTKEPNELQEYPTMVLSPQNAVLESIYPANIKGQADIEIRPRIDGTIRKINVDEGSLVRKGQSLFEIDSPGSEQALRTAEASVTTALANLQTAELNVNRIRPLAEKGIVSQVQLETYENSYKSAQAALAQANASLTNAKATMQWTYVNSPIDGIVGNIPYRLGSYVNSANALTTVANTGQVYVYFSINEKETKDLLAKLDGKNQAEKISNMPEVTLILADGSTYEEKGKITTITGQANVTTGSVNFRADFPNPHGILKSGFSGKVVIPKYIDSTFVIPQKSTFMQQNKVLVYKVEGDSAVQELITVLPIPGGKDYAVTSGLSKGDKIITDGIATLSNGKKIKSN